MSNNRQLLTRDEFEQLKHAPKAKILQVLEQFVVKDRGRKPEGSEAMSTAERVKAYRERKRLERQEADRKRQK